MTAEAMNSPGRTEKRSPRREEDRPAVASPIALVVEDDSVALDSLSSIVEREGFEVAKARSLEEARAELTDSRPQVILLDISLPDGSGLDLLDEVGEDPQIDVILVTGNATIESAVKALREGVRDYFTKPVDVQRLRLILSNLVRSRELEAEVDNLREQLMNFGRFGQMIGRSPAMQQVYHLIRKGAPTDVTILLTGDSGTGKEVAAQTIHQFSKRRRNAFLPLNCGAVSPGLIESQLFGHEKGSFTGAARTHKGFFERAHGGTLFLDEITEMPLELQVKLLRVLETSKLIRVGGDDVIEVDTRVIAASNRNLDEALRDGKIREDLLYRLKVFPIDLPPLSEREGDALLLARYFLDQLNAEHETSKRFSEAVLRRFQTYGWPGNVRELKNVVHRAFIVADSELTVGMLPPEMQQPDERNESGDLGSKSLAVNASDSVEAAASTGAVQIPVGTSLAHAEKQLILATIERCDGNKRKAAETLGFSLRSLYNRLKTYREEEQS